MKPIQVKSENYEKVMESTLSFIASKGLERLTVSTIARLSKVSRTWIYKYIGSSKESLIRCATLHIGKLFSEMEERPETTNRAELIESLNWGNRQFIINVRRFPWIPGVYFKYSHSKNPFGSAVQEVLEAYHSILAIEIMAGLKISKKEALPLAELYTAMKMGAGYWWATSPIPLNPKHEPLLAQQLDAMIATVVPGAGSRIP